MEAQINYLQIQEWIERSKDLFIKKLSRNDCGWADGQQYGHQNGVYIPREVRESGFFPEISNVNQKKSHIFETSFKTYWPEINGFRQSNLKHYSNKGSEMHFTRVPKELFSNLTPASWLLSGKLKSEEKGAKYWFVVIDSSTESAELLETTFDLHADFHFGLFKPENVLLINADETAQLIDDINNALRSGKLHEYILAVSTLPRPEVLAKQAQEKFMKENGLNTLNPYLIENPGDVIMKISRDIEYSLYKQVERRFRAAEVVRIIYEHGNDLVNSVVRGFPELDASFLSASQHRKSRAGRSFEHHISRLLIDGKVMFEEQVVTGGRRPDFVLPNLRTLNNKARNKTDALVLSAKTTLRERWKQITLEKFNCEIFLATVDDRVTAEALNDMREQSICLVVPESLKKSKETCYKDQENVITFKSFFEDRIGLISSSLKST